VQSKGKGSKWRSLSLSLWWPTFAQLNSALPLTDYSPTAYHLPFRAVWPWLIMSRCLGSIVVYFYSRPHSTVSFLSSISIPSIYLHFTEMWARYARPGRIAAINLFVVHICLGRLLLATVAQPQEKKRNGEERTEEKRPWNNGLKERETRNKKRLTNCA